jgi:hypothetical protein
MPSCSPNGIEQLTLEARSSWQYGEVTQKAIRQVLAE